MAQYQLFNARTGFRVDVDYFKNKQRFSAGIDPNDGNSVSVVEAWTENVVDGLRVDIDPSSSTYRQVI